MHEDLVGFNCRSFSTVQLNILFKYGWRVDSALCIFVCEVSGLRSSAYDSSWTFGGGCGMSDTYRLKKVGDSTHP